MITVKDCENVCDAHPDWLHELACRECMTLVPAYADAHEVAVCADYLAVRTLAAHAAPGAGQSSDFRPSV